MDEFENLLQNCEDANQLWNAGCNYYNGNNGVEKDYEKAFKLYEKAVALSSYDAENMLGYMYQNGFGVEKDEKAAFDWYVRCAEHGNAWGQANAGWCLTYGVGTGIDYLGAVGYFENAMKQQSYPNSAPSILGEIYEKGWGVDNDLKKALYYYLIAADYGNEYSKDQIDRVEGLLGEEAYDVYQAVRDETGSWIAGEKLTKRKQAIVEVCKSLHADYSYPFFLSKDGKIIKELIDNVAHVWGPQDELVIPDNVEDIECVIPRRFYEKIVFPDGIRHISANWKSEDDMDHGGNWTIKEIIIPSTVESVDEKAFEYFDALQSIIVPDGEVERMKYIFPARLSVLIKGTICEAEDGAQFSGGGTLFVKAPKTAAREYVVPEGVKVICNHAFENCYGLEHIVLPRSLEGIEKEAFGSLLSLEKITFLSMELKTIGDYAFSGTSLTRISLPDSVELIGNYAFKDCRNLESINIPKSLKYIGCGVFMYCYRLSSELEFPDVMETFAEGEYSGPDTFLDCWSLRSVVLPKGMTEIGSGMFRNCLSLSGIRIPDLVTRIGEGAFANCALAKLELPESLSEIEMSFDGKNGPFDGQDIEFVSRSSAFIVRNGDLLAEDGTVVYDHYVNAYRAKTHVSGDESNRRVNSSQQLISKEGTRFIRCGNDSATMIPKGITVILDNAFTSYSRFTELVVPEGVKYLGERCFAQQFDLKSVILPSSIEMIGEGAFVSTAIVSLEIPKKVKYVGPSPFGDTISRLIFRGIPERIDWEIDEWGFNMPKNLESIVIPKGSMGQFKELLDDKLHRFLIESD